MSGYSSRQAHVTTSPWVKARATHSTPVESTLGDRIPADNRLEGGRIVAPGHEHKWWHAEGIERHLVCLTCGTGWYFDTSKDFTFPRHVAGLEQRACRHVPYNYPR